MFGEWLRFHIAKNWKCHVLDTHFVKDRWYFCRIAIKLYTDVFRRKDGLRYREFYLKKCRGVIDDHAIEMKEEPQHRSVFCKRYFGESEVESKVIKEYISPEIYVAVIEDAIVIGNSTGIVVDDYYINDYLAQNYRFASLSGVEYLLHKDRIGLVYRANISGELGEAVSIVSSESDNLFHLCVEVLGRLIYVLNDSRYRCMPIMIAQEVLENENLLSFVKAVVGEKRSIIGVRKEECYRVKKLIFPSSVSWMPMNIKSGYKLQNKDTLLCKSSLLFVRNCVLEKMKIERKSESKCEKIYISRKKVKSNRLANEEEIEYIAKQHGFKIVYPETLSFNEQVQVFYFGRIIVGCAGAAFTNLLFCTEGSKAYLIAPKSHRTALWSTYAENIGVNLEYLEGNVIKQGKAWAQDEFCLDLSYFEEFLQQLQ